MAKLLFRSVRVVVVVGVRKTTPKRDVFEDQLLMYDKRVVG